MTTLQTIICATPAVLLLASTIFPSFTRYVWVWKKYIIYLIISVLYGLMGLWIFDFKFENPGIALTFIPIIYFFFCYLFDKIFQKIKPANVQREFPLFVLFGDPGVDNSYVEKFGIEPISADKKVSFGVVLCPFLVLLVLMQVLD